MTDRPLRIGVVYPQIELGGDPQAVRAIAAATEELGFDHLLAYDHVLGAARVDRDPPLPDEFPYDADDPFHEPLVMFAHLAALHPRLEFATGVIIAPQRQTALLARQAADVALLSGNRLRLGIGVGWNHVEYDALGMDFGTRGRREDEQVALLRRLWSEDLVSFDGEFDRIDRAALNPRPTAPVPIWIGGFSPPAFDRGARLGDGFIFGGRTAEATDAWAQVQSGLQRHGRADEDFGADWLVRAHAPGAAGIERRQHDWTDVGGTHLSVVTMGLGLDSLDAHLDELAATADALGLRGSQQARG